MTIRAGRAAEHPPGRQLGLVPAELAGPATQRPDAVAGLAVHPPAEAFSTTRVRAFGYLRSTRREDAKLSILHGELILHAGRTGLDLVDVYDDVPCGDVAPEQRPGFGWLLAALWRQDGARVVVPARCHLSWRPTTYRDLERRIRDTGAEVATVWGDHERPELQP